MSITPRRMGRLVVTLETRGGVNLYQNDQRIGRIELLRDGRDTGRVRIAVELARDIIILRDGLAQKG